MKFMQEEAVDVAILSDPYKIRDNGSESVVNVSTQKAAIIVPGKQISVSNVIRDAELVSAKVDGYQIYSYYTTPNPATRDAFGNLLNRLEDSIRLVPHGTPVVVAGDFNARSAAWDDWTTTSRGDELSDLFGSLQLIVRNEGSIPTFTRGEESIVDVTATSANVTCLDWGVLSDTFNHNDHNYVRFDLGNGHRVRRPYSITTFREWDISKGIDPGLLEVGLLIADWLNPVEDHRGSDANHIAGLFEDQVNAACSMVVQRKTEPSSTRKPVNWWNPELTTLKSFCIAGRRKSTSQTARFKRLRSSADDLVIAQAAAEANDAAALLKNAKKVLRRLSK